MVHSLITLLRIDRVRMCRFLIEQGTQAFPGTGAHYVKGITIRHHDFPRQFELEFLKAGYDPDLVGRALSKDAHKAMHHGNGWGRGGPWNYQWERFFHNGRRGMRFEQSDPYGSIKSFLELLRQVDPEIGNWPYTP